MISIASRHNEMVRAAYAKGYRIDPNDGLVIGMRGRKLSGNPVTQKGYSAFSFELNGVRETVQTHRFAAYSYFGEETFEEGIQVRHLNSNKLDNSRKNIALGTAKENDSDKTPEARKRSTDAVIKASTGRAPVNRKLTPEQVRDVRKRLEDGEVMRLIAEDYDITITAVWYIKIGETYRTVV